MADSEYIDGLAPGQSPTTQILPIAEAILRLRPGRSWHLLGFEYEGLVWEDDINLVPSKEEVIALAQVIYNEAPLKELRRQRDNRMKEVDWVTLRSMRTGEPIPQEWLDYMQALADITVTCPNPRFGQDKRTLDNVTWPERPDGKPAGPFRGY